MESLLVKNPEQYLFSTGVQVNQKELEISTEIFLSEKALYPSFQNNYIKNKELKEQYDFFKKQYQKKYPHHFVKDALISIFYFTFIQFSIDNFPLIKDFALWKNYVAYKVISDLDLNDALKSRVSNRLLKLNNYYHKTILYNEEVLREELKNKKNIQDIIDIMILQNNEIYSLETERLEQTEDYYVYEKHRSDLQIADYLTEY